MPTDMYVKEACILAACILASIFIGDNTQDYLSKVSCWSPQAGRSVKLAQWALTTHYLGDLKSVR
jgi:hypothetical protein